MATDSVASWQNGSSRLAADGRLAGRRGDPRRAGRVALGSGAGPEPNFSGLGPGLFDGRRQFGGGLRSAAGPRPHHLPDAEPKLQEEFRQYHDCLSGEAP